MNWLGTSAEVGRWLADERSDRCSHVEADPATAYSVLTEDDSFGPVARNVVCKACYDAVKSSEAAELHTCHDCQAEIPLKEGRLWRWYDFYAPQGDEPMFLCVPCWGAPKHIERRRRDKEAEREELED